MAAGTALEDERGDVLVEGDLFSGRNWISREQPSATQRDHRQGRKRSRSHSSFSIWQLGNRTADCVGASDRHEFTGKNRFQSVAEVVRRDIRPPLAESSILVVDPSAIEQIARGRKNGGFGRYRGAGTLNPLMPRIEGDGQANFVLLRVRSGPFGC